MVELSQARGVVQRRADVQSKSKQKQLIAS
jgi:hypothetical protein